MNTMTMAAICMLGAIAAQGAQPTTYCNPMSLPGIPISRNTREGVADFAEKRQHRELADPSLLVEGKTIYCYPSNDMAWKSTGRTARRGVRLSMHHRTPSISS